MTAWVCIEIAQLSYGGDPIWVGLAGPDLAMGCKTWLPLSQAITTLDTAVSPDVLGITDAALVEALGKGAALVIGLWVLGLCLGWAIKATQAFYKED